MIGFVENRGELLFGNDFRGDEESQPVVRFAGLFSGDIHLCDEVRFALATVGFFDVRSNGCA